MANHGGEHAWDITHAQAKDALYVSSPQQKDNNHHSRAYYIYVVVQYRISRIRIRHLPHETLGTNSLPTSLLPGSIESFRLYYCRTYRRHGMLLHQHMHRENHAMHAPSQNLGSLDSGNMHQRIGLAQHKWFFQHNYGLYYSHSPHTFCAETAAQSDEEGLGCLGFS